MDFFKLQDKAKSQTFWLVILFCIGLIVLPFIGAHIITFSVNLFIMPKNRSSSAFMMVTIALTSIILLVSLYKYLSLRQGGKVIAISLGGRLIDKRAANASERRLLNVVEEMAIASNLPVPHVYVMDEENNINAFAAGHTINDAIIGVTRGTVELLTRDELQAVIAHEFSHILNGDMRLNLRFTALLFGFMFITQAGYVLLRWAFNVGTSDRKGVVPHLIFIAFAFLAAGFLGQVWARIMQAAVNRQREYLADASSVQFTRHGKALASALKKIGGSEGAATLQVAVASSYNHFFFGQADFNLLATHPPLDLRIKRIEPWWRGEYITPDFSKLIRPEPERQENDQIKDKRLTAAIAVGIAITGKDAIPYLKPVTLLNTNVTNQEQAIAKLETICHEPMDACYLMFAMVVDTIPSIRAKQFTVVKNTELITDYYQTLSLVNEEKHLEYIEKAIPALKNLSADQYKHFKSVLMHFIQADNQISLNEWLIYQLIIHQVDGQFNPKAITAAPLYSKLDQLMIEVATMLSAIAYLAEDAMDQKRAFGLGSNIMGLYTIQLQEEKPTINQLTISLQKLQRSTEAVRKRFLQGALPAIEQDKQMTVKKAMFFRVLSLCLDCPITPLCVTTNNSNY